MKKLYASIFMSMFLLSAFIAQGQFQATGTVVDYSDEPLIGVSVVVQGTTIGAITDIDGKYSLQVPSDEAVLEFSYIGYSTQTYEVSSLTPSATITLEESATQLGEVVITGLGSSVKRKNSANAVASISGAELTGVTTQSTMDGALYGKFAGADLRSNSGAPGGGMSVRLRGVTSIFGDQQPLYIVDGIYVDNRTTSLGTNIISAAAGGGNTSTNQDDASNRIADIDPEDIENIEILKGASAAAIYGNRAAGGVVIITTKRGKAGETRVSFNQTFSAISAIRLLGQRDWDEELVRSEFGDSEVERFNANAFTDYEKEVFGNTAFGTTSRLEVSGGNDKTTFLVGGTYKDEDGIVQNTGYQKSNLRLNITQKFTEWLDIDVTSSYINSTSDRGFFNNSNTNSTVGYALAFTRPWDVLQADEQGVFPAINRVGSNALETISEVTNRENVNRFLAGGTLTARLLQTDKSDLRVILRGGLDQYTLNTTSIFPRTLSYLRSPGTLNGVSISGSTNQRTLNWDAILVHSLYTDSGLNFRTQLGATAQDFEYDNVITTGVGLIGTETNVDQSANQSLFQNRRPQEDQGFFIQEEVNWNDRIIATVGLRTDRSSNNGDVNKFYYYPKANLALNLSEFDFWTNETIELLKLRVAYGEAGRFANFGSTFTAYNATLLGMNAGAFTDVQIGNPEVEPERQKELEFGADLGLLNGRVGFSATYYIKTNSDLLLNNQVPTSTGFTREVLNGAELRNNGIELELNAAPITGKIDWSTSLRWWRNRSTVTRLDVPAFNLGGFAASLGQLRIEEGKSPTQVVGLPNTEDGFTVFGDAQADFDMSWFNNLSIGAFDFSMLWHWKQGGDVINLSPLLYDFGRVTWDADDTNADPAGELTNRAYRLANFGVSAAPWVEDGSFIRMREVAAYYTLPKSIFNDVVRLKVGVSGRNLINIFDYNGYDPEVSNFGNNVLANNIEVTPFPSSKRINFHIKASF